VGTETCNFNNPYVDGTGTAASVQSNGMTRDSAGNLYVVSGSDDVVRKITPAGVVTTIAGLYLTDGNVDGTAGAARFHDLSGIAADMTGSLYVTEVNDVRKVTPAGVVTTVAGSAAQGFVNGSGAAALLNVPAGVVFDGAGNAYVADSGNEAIRKITPAGAVTTLAGGAALGFADGTGTAALFNNPFAIAIDAAGNLFVSDVSNSAIRKVTPGGVVTTFAGGTYGFADGTGTAARFNAPRELAFDSAGNLYVIDQGYEAIRVVTPAGVVTTLAIYKNFAAFGISGALPPASVQLAQQPVSIAGNPSGAPYVGMGCAVERIGP
jgi:hypothetical protein